MTNVVYYYIQAIVGGGGGCGGDGRALETHPSSIEYGRGVSGGGVVFNVSTIMSEKQQTWSMK